jgi:serine protease Do
LRLIVFSALLLFPLSVIEGKIGPAQTSGPASFSRLVKKASPSVVNISAVRIVRRHEEMQQPFAGDDPLQEFFNRFFRHQIPPGSKQNSLGTGFIIDKQGFILTNNHVVEQTEDIKVRLADDREYSAEIVGRDPLTDLALIRIEADYPLISLKLGNSDLLEVGDWVVAIGNPFGLGHTVSAGIVSAMYRQIGAGPYENFIQTDAPINPGNSGGPLLNTAGEVVGITTLIFSQSGGNIGIGFAIPVNMAKDLLPQLKKGRVVRGWIGIMIQKVTPALKEKLKLNDERGALVADVLAGGPADKAGIRRGDVMVSFDGKKIKDANELPHVVASGSIGKAVMVEVMRMGQKQHFRVSVEELPEDNDPLASPADSPELGMVLQQVTPELARQYDLPRTGGLLVVEVEIESEAYDAGIEPGDIILEVDQIPVKDLTAFNKKVDEYGTGQTVLLLVDRGGSTLFVTLEVR